MTSEKILKDFFFRGSILISLPLSGMGGIKGG